VCDKNGTQIGAGAGNSTEGSGSTTLLYKVTFPSTYSGQVGYIGIELERLGIPLYCADGNGKSAVVLLDQRNPAFSGNIYRLAVDVSMVMIGNSPGSFNLGMLPTAPIPELNFSSITVKLTPPPNAGRFTANMMYATTKESGLAPEALLGIGEAPRSSGTGVTGRLFMTTDATQFRLWVLYADSDGLSAYCAYADVVVFNQDGVHTVSAAPDRIGYAISDAKMLSAYTAAALKNPAMLDENIILTRDIRCAYGTADANYIGFEGWTPIGGYKAFTGIFDGAGYTVSAIKLNVSLTMPQIAGYVALNGPYFGFFGATDGAVIKNVLFSGFQPSIITLPAVTEKVAAGSFIGSAKDTLISNVSVNAPTYIQVQAAGPIVAGGFVGEIFGDAPPPLVNIQSSTAIIVTSTGENATVSGGGLTGRAANLTLQHCLAQGLVRITAQQTAYAGGLVGSGSDLTIQGSVAYGDVTASAAGAVFADALLGTLADTTAAGSCTIDASSGTGTVTVP
jgi:hypothetical protein